MNLFEYSKWPGHEPEEDTATQPKARALSKVKSENNVLLTYHDVLDNKSLQKEIILSWSWDNKRCLKDFIDRAVTVLSSRLFQRGIILSSQ